MPPDGSTVVTYSWVAGWCLASPCGFNVLTNSRPGPNLTSPEPLSIAASGFWSSPSQACCASESRGPLGNNSEAQVLS